MVIFLIGYMGCGKSTTGRRVARRLAMRFQDMDLELARQAGMEVAEIFSRLGEGLFRQMEREYLSGDLAASGPMIVATGGGTPCQGDNMEFMNSKGYTVYLRMSVPKLFTRLERGASRRPLIKGMGAEQLAQFIERNLEKREPAYMKARVVIECDEKSDAQIEDAVVSHIEKIMQSE